MPEKTVAEKLMIRPGRRVLIANPPVDYLAILGPGLPTEARLLEEGGDAPVDGPAEPTGTEPDIILAFANNRQELEDLLPRLKPQLAPGGMIWMIYRKGAAKEDIQRDIINRDTINSYAQSIGLTGVAMIAANEEWSALRLKVA